MMLHDGIDNRVTIIVKYGSMALAVWLLSLLWGVPFTCPDDMAIAASSYLQGGIWQASQQITFQTGRFYQIVYFSLTQIPYIFDSILYTIILRIVSAAIPIIAFFVFLTVIFKSRPIAFFGVAVLAALVEATSAYNSFHALPFWFNFAFGLMLFSFALFQVAEEKSSSKMRLASFLVFFLAMLSYELFPLYGIGFLFLALANRHRAGDSLSFWRALSKKFAPLAVIYVFYLALYVGFKQYVGVVYEGTVLAWDSPMRILRAIGIFSFGGFNFFEWLLIDFTHLKLKHSLPGLVFLAVGFAFTKYALDGRRTFRITWSQIAIFLPFVFLPNILYGFVERYRDWAEGSRIYLGNYYSAFALATIFALLVVKIGQLVGQSGSRLSMLAFRLVVPVLLTVVALGAIKKNSDFFDIVRGYSSHWKIVDSLIERGKLSEVKDGDVIVLNSLLTFPVMSNESYPYWQVYIGKRLGRHFRTVHEVKALRPEDEGARKVYLQTFKPGKEIYAVFGIVDSVLNGEAFAKHIRIFGLKPSSRDQIQFNVVDSRGEHMRSILLDGVDMEFSVTSPDERIALASLRVVK